MHRDHVLRGVEQGIVQVNHGSRAGVERMAPGDGVVYYSPRDAYPVGDALRAITPLLPVLELTRDTPNRGWLMRRGLLELTAHDFGVIAHEMGADTLVP